MKKESLKFSIHNLIIDAIVAGAGIRACTIARRRAMAVRKVLEMRAVGFGEEGVWIVWRGCCKGDD